MVGYLGGIWVWEYLSASEFVKDKIISPIKRFGWAGIIIFLGLIIATVYFSFTTQASILFDVINFLNWVMLFMLAYNSGYLLSIWRNPLQIDAKKPEANDAKMLDKRIIKAVFRMAVPSLLIIMGTSVVIGIVKGNINFVLLALGIQVLLFSGFCLGYIIWEHLKKTELILGAFKEQLKIISIIFLIILAALTIIGFYYLSIQPILVQSLRDLMLYYSVFLVCMLFYFVGLYVSIARSN